MNKLKKIKDMTLEEYTKLLRSGLFWVLFPEAAGDYEEDKELSKNNKFKIECK